tara:strand:+ start:5521 stop:5634 length:114 start_codon:yes stop_codon:yes gene_type:complete
MMLSNPSKESPSLNTLMRQLANWWPTFSGFEDDGEVF